MLLDDRTNDAELGVKTEPFDGEGIKRQEQVEVVERISNKSDADFITEDMDDSEFKQLLEEEVEKEIQVISHYLMFMTVMRLMWIKF